MTTGKGGVRREASAPRKFVFFTRNVEKDYKGRKGGQKPFSRPTTRGGGCRSCLGDETRERLLQLRSFIIGTNSPSHFFSLSKRFRFSARLCARAIEGSYPPPLRPLATLTWLSPGFYLNSPVTPLILFARRWTQFNSISEIKVLAKAFNRRSMLLTRKPLR